MNKVNLEGIKRIDKYTKRPEITKENVEDAIKFVLKKIDENIHTFTYKYPAPVSKNSVYEAIENNYWTCSFWTGMLWLAYEVTGDEKYRKVAEIQLKSFKQRLEEKIETDTHDLGFLFTLSCVAGYKLIGDEEAKVTALAAAGELMKRYFDKAGSIQAWGDLQDPKQRGRMIIDCCIWGDYYYFEALLVGKIKQRKIHRI